VSGLPSCGRVLDMTSRDTARAMSQEHVDRFVEVTEVFNRFGAAPEAVDPADVKSWIGFFDPNVQFVPQQAALEGGYVGHEGVGQWLADLAEHYAGGHMDLPDIRDLGNRVLALGTLRVTGRGSGIEAEVPVAIMASFRNGLITQFRDYGDKDQALEAAGLSE
jgi:ketosteroid isomerase-like protein